MGSFEEQRLKLLSDIGNLVKAVEDEADWLIASIRERDERKRAFYRSIYVVMREERARIAKELYEQYK